MLRSEKVFLETIEDLKSRINNDPFEQTNYNIMKAAALLRGLFLDGGDSLFSQVNRKYKMKIRFEVKKGILGLMPDSTLNDAIDIRPDFRDHDEVNLNEFLDLPLLIQSNEIFNVRNFIQAGANLLGGVHESRVELAAMSLRDQLLVDIGMDESDADSRDVRNIVEHGIIDIANIALKALEPLVKKINEGAV